MSGGEIRMAHEPRTIHIHDGSELARALEEADSTPVRLEKGGIAYRLVREDEAGAPESDASTIAAAVDATTGSWSDLNADEVIDYIYRGREEGTRPASRP
jgi:hypothetical protein